RSIRAPPWEPGTQRRSSAAGARGTFPGSPRPRRPGAAGDVAVPGPGRPEPRQRRTDGSAELRPGVALQVLAGGSILRARGLRGDGLDVALAEQDELLALQLHLQARGRGGEHASALP